MRNDKSKPIRILGIAPSTRGFGFAVLEPQNTLVDWGVKTVKGEKNSATIARIEDLILQYQPDVITVPTVSEEASLRSERIRELIPQIVAMAKSHNLVVDGFSQV